MKKKIRNLNRRTRLENIILDLERLDKSDEVKEQLELLKIELIELTRQANRAPRDDHKLYLSEIIEMENPEFGSNNLILAPVGSGKSTLIEKVLIENKPGKVLMLVSNRYLRDDIAPDNNEIKRERARDGYSKMMFTTKNRSKYGKMDYEVHVMTYSEYGHRIRDNDNFLEGIDKIFCDEIHSLPEYKNISQSEYLSIALRSIFQIHEGKQIFYFTATDENLITLRDERPALMSNVKTFDYREHKDIVRYMELSKYEINHVEQIRPHLKARVESFSYFRLKGLAFSKTISGQKRIEQILKDEGFNPLVLWSDANRDHPLTDEQLSARKTLIETNEIPDPYNFLVINSAMREGWSLKDDKVKLAIMNTTNDTDLIQARGRLRGDLDILIYRTADTELKDFTLEIPDRYIDNPLTTKTKKRLCEELNITDSQGRLSRWNAIKKLLFQNGYDVIDTTKMINGKQARVSIIIDS